MTRNLPFSRFLPWTFLCTLSLALFTGCASAPETHLEELEVILKSYNNAFEAKQENGGVQYVKGDMRTHYLMKYAEIRKRVSFSSSILVNKMYYQGENPVLLDEKKMKSKKKEFNKAILTMRYELIVKPSNQVKTLVHNQNWVYANDHWELEPDLEPFLN